MRGRKRAYVLSRANDSDNERDLNTIFARNVSMGRGKTKRRTTTTVTRKAAAIRWTTLYSQGDWVSAWTLANNNPRWEAWVCNLKASVVHTKNFNKSDNPLLYWASRMGGDGYRQEALTEFMRLEGHGDYAKSTHCPSLLGDAAGVSCLCGDEARSTSLSYYSGKAGPVPTLRRCLCMSLDYEYSLAIPPHRVYILELLQRISRLSTLTGFIVLLWISAGTLLYMLILALDANFRLKNLYRSNWLKDPGLHMGLAYFLEPVKYLEHVTHFASQKDISTCSGFQTLAHAESRNVTGLRATGVGMCENGTDFLPPGSAHRLMNDRYCNMDYIALSAVQGHGVKSLFWSYDIVCQWKINLFERMAELPVAFQQDPVDIQFHFAVPKCHCKGHKLKCQCYHSMNVQIIGRTDGEGIERAWAEINVVANSTKEMGPGNRYDKLDGQFAKHNWKKLVGLGTYLRQKRKMAQVKAIKHLEGFQALTDVLPRDHFAKEWTAEIEAWERDHSLPSPYFIEVAHKWVVLLIELATHEQERVAALKDGISFSDSTAASCIELALVVEDLQRRLLQDLKDEADETCLHDATDFRKKRITLQKQLAQFRELQAITMPCTRSILQEAIGDPGDVEHHKLWLPSELEEPLQVRGCMPGVRDAEEKLREAQCKDALVTLRSTLRAQHSLFTRRNKNFRGQRQNTRVAEAAHRLDTKCKLAAAKYNTARGALLILRGPGDWEQSLRELRSNDCVSLHGSVLEIDSSSEEDETLEGQAAKKRRTQVQPQGEGHKEVSWIWMQEGALGDGEDEALNQAVKLEWLKSRARSMRWREEGILVQEEMCRTLVSLQWEANKWGASGSGWEGLDPVAAEGVQAYAARQARLYHCLETHFRNLWDMEAEVPGADDDSESEMEVDGLGDRNRVEEGSGRAGRVQPAEP
ncbi:hypothetical protein ARMSODRAFT_1016067 [Armillaria solidipes]|uniref:CxC2-like cysteine cluster KDZ transposase-associated domain-containing protein n=1 Tax=Armillaria solidipes TaxID=1076256 RepID=A0A2H3BMF4_9AGAR|nr:hypothetical protein ARMSODRAFT_1016067 [Armillaria solidipes]